MIKIEIITSGERLLEIPTKILLAHINSLIEEKTYIFYDEKFSFEKEQEWKENTAKKLESGNTILVFAWDNEKLIGVANVNRGEFKQRFNATIGIGISKEYRGKGIGEKLLKQCIKFAKKYFKPKNILLSADSKNKIAINLYKKLGFKEIAVFKNNLYHYGEWHDHIFMELGKMAKKKNKTKA